MEEWIEYILSEYTEQDVTDTLDDYGLDSLNTVWEKKMTKQIEQALSIKSWGMPE